MPDITSTTIRIATGVVAGAAATWSAKRVVEFLESRAGGVDRQPNKTAQRKSTEDALLDTARDKLGVRLSGKQRERALRGVHWVTGLAGGVGMTLLRRRLGANQSPLKGALFGVVTFFLIDEVLKPALGVYGTPRRSLPWQVHAREAASHATYGLVSAGVRNAVSKMLPHIDTPRVVRTTFG